MKTWASVNVLGTRVDAVTYTQVVSQIVEWARARQSRYVCVANVHMIMEAHDDPRFQQVVTQADLVVPDGMPLVWWLRRSGWPHQSRVYGPELMRRLLAAATLAQVPVGLYGATSATLRILQARLRAWWPGLRLAWAYSPPFRPLTPQEDARIVAAVRRQGVRLLFVALGCPRQERWMAAHKGRIPAVMVGVGAAFDFLAGVKPQAPPWMQRLGLEWLFRLWTEPRRLARRYLYHNPRFLALAARAWWQARARRG